MAVLLVTYDINVVLGFRGPLGGANAEPPRENIRERTRQETLASQRNMRQSQYMSQRPAVVAAMKLKQVRLADI